MPAGDDAGNNLVIPDSKDYAVRAGSNEVVRTYNIVEGTRKSAAGPKENPMKPTIIFPLLAVATIVVSGCASVAETSDTASVETKCKIVMAQPARLNYDPARATDADKIAARAKLASYEMKLPPLRNQTGLHGTIEQALRDCP